MVLFALNDEFASKLADKNVRFRERIKNPRKLMFSPVFNFNESRTEIGLNMKKIASIFLAAIFLVSCSTAESKSNNEKLEYMETTVKITIGIKTFEAEIADNKTGKAFLEKLPLELKMSDMNGNEKCISGISLPKNDSYYDTLEAGDLMLWSGNYIVLFYDKAGGYSYSRIGKIKNAAGIKAAVGSGSVTVKFEK